MSEKNVLLLTGVGVLACMVGVFVFIVVGDGDSSQTETATQPSSSSMVAQDDSSSSVSTNSGMATTQPTQMDSQPPTPGQFLAYSESAVDESTAEHRVLFFHATWCPSCIATKNQINNSLSEIPSDVDIFDVDYDDNMSLRQQYQVRTQHAFVTLDADGNASSVAYGLSSLEDIVEFAESN